MPYKNPHNYTITLNDTEAEKLETLAKKQNITPYALIKKIIKNELEEIKMSKDNMVPSEVLEEMQTLIKQITEQWESRGCDIQKDINIYCIKSEAFSKLSTSSKKALDKHIETYNNDYGMSNNIKFDVVLKALE